jgi:NACHT domain
VNDKRTQRVRLLVLVASGSGVAIFTGTLLSTGDTGIRIATILVLPVTLISVYISAIGWVRGRTADDSELHAASSEILYDLGQAIVDAEQRVLATGMNAPIEIAYAEWPSNGMLRTVGRISNIYDYFLLQPAGRMVILGDGGSGKTVLALEFALQMIRTQREAPTNDTGVIPLRLSLPAFISWDSERSRDAAYLAKRIEDWIIAEVQAATNQPRFIARALVRSRLVLPILDGLDEMDRDDATPENAMAVLRGLNYPTISGLIPAVVICRTKRFEELDSSLDHREVLANSTTIQMLPLDRSGVAAYLETQADRLSRPDKWREITDILRDAPISPIAESVASPLDLYLLMSSPERLIAELVSLNRQQLRRVLLDSLIPASLSRGIPHLSYTSEAVACWLRTLARGLASQAMRGESETDIDVATVWKLGGTRLPRAASAAATLLIGFCILLAPFGWARYSRHQWLPLIGKQWFIDSSGVTLALVAAFRASLPHHKVVRMDITALTRESGRRRIRHYVGVFFVVGFISGSFFLVLFGWAFAISFCLAVAIALGALYGLVRAPALIASPRRFIRDAMLADFFILSEVAIIYGLTNGLANGLVHRTYGGLIFGLAYGWLLSMAVRATSPWLRYLLVVLTLSRQGKLPLRLGEFLEWGIQVGLLRQSATRVQFRHSVLRDYFS